MLKSAVYKKTSAEAAEVGRVTYSITIYRLVPLGISLTNDWITIRV